MNALLPLAGLLDWFATETGPVFLIAFAVWFLVCFTTLVVLRGSGHDHWRTTLVCFCLFEGVGLIRYLAGSNAGLHRWGFMVVMMFVGGCLFFVRKESDNSSDGSSCGDGCGGGGCGGCGGGGD